MDARIDTYREQIRLVDLHPRVETVLKRYPQVVDVGVGIKEVAGKLTKDLCYRVYVNKKLPPSALNRHEIIPRTILGFKTDVLVKQPTVLNSLPDTAEYASLRGGVQIRNEYFEGDNVIGAGTIGCLARTNDAANKLVGLSASHVLIDGRTGSPLPAVTTVEIGHPRWIKCCCCCSYNEVGNVMQVSSVAGLDCGIFELDGSAAGDVSSNGTENLIQDIGTIAGVAQVVCNEIVRKRGAATGITQGVVVDVLYETSKILINPCAEHPVFSAAGDSGAVIVNADNKVVGLLIGSSRSIASNGVAHHIKPVLTELNIKIAGQGASTVGLVGVPASNCPPGGATTCSGGVALSMAASAQYFRDLDDGTLYLSQQAAYISEAPTGPLHERRNDIFGLVVPALAPRMFSQANGWVERAKNNQIADPLTVTVGSDPTLYAAIQRLSTYQLNLLKTHFPGTSPGTMDIPKVRVTFERFMNGELRERPSGVHPYGPSQLLTDGPREPNGSFEMMFSGFAWLCIENSIDAAEWTPLYNLMVQCQEMFMFVYRRRPQVAPPNTGSIAVPSFTLGSAGFSLEPAEYLGRRVQVGEPGFGDSGFSFDHFNLTSTTSAPQMQLDVASVTSPAQSSETRKLALRAKYALLDYNGTKNAMKENIQRMLYMP